MKQILFILSGLSMLALPRKAFSQTYSSSGPIAVIAGTDCPGLGAPGSSVINVPTTGTIATASDVFINLSLAAGCLATSKIVLVAPDGDSCILINMPYRVGPCGATCLETISTNTLTFNSTYTTSIPDTDPVVPSGNYAPSAGSFAPEVGNLNTFLTGKSINGNWTLKGFADAAIDFELSSWSIVFGSTALPLDLLGFSGRSYANYNQLQWSTASEKNTASFDIQRSGDGSNYQTIGKVTAKGAGSNLYSFRDESYSHGLNLYRLRMIDINGEYTYSKTIKISGDRKQGAGVKFSPNPAKDVFNITLVNKDLLHTEGKILNTLGQTVLTIKLDQENIKSNIGHLPVGVYYLRLSDGNHYQFVKEN